ncbi:MAG: toll/interleukin-1 receptor domain-containing protein, partial [Allosphingosinicella sp.]
MADVFISHSSKDRAVADAARDRIERAGFRCWMAPRDIMPGQDYGEAIVDAIRESRTFLLIFSSASVDSAQVRRETERAANAGLAIIPFRIEDVQPSKSLEYFISSAHWLDAHQGPMEPYFDYLVEVVSKQLGAPSQARGSSPAVVAMPRPSPPPQTRPSWPLADAAVAGLVLIAAVLLLRPEAGGRNCTNVPDTARTGFTLRVSPVRSD